MIIKQPKVMVITDCECFELDLKKYLVIEDYWSGKTTVQIEGTIRDDWRDYEQVDNAK